MRSASHDRALVSPFSEAARCSPAGTQDCVTGISEASRRLDGLGVDLAFSLSR